MRGDICHACKQFVHACGYGPDCEPTPHDIQFAEDRKVLRAEIERLQSQLRARTATAAQRLRETDRYVARSRASSRRKRRARREADAKWFDSRCIDAVLEGVRGNHAVIIHSCSPDFDGDITREDGSVNWAAAFAAP